MGLKGIHILGESKESYFHQNKNSQDICITIEFSVGSKEVGLKSIFVQEEFNSCKILLEYYII
jgi:hypothetical protein